MPDAAAIRSEIQRVLCSPGFENAERLKQLLLYTTERALTGKAGELKEYSIGVDVFGRGDSFDPKTDSIVRVTAGKLRLKLKEYYLANPETQIQIQLPAGSYIPLFVERQQPAVAMQSTGGRKRSVMWLTAALSMVVLAVGVAAIFSSGTPPRRKLRKVTSDIGVTSDPAISRDGKLLAYVSNRERGRLQLYVQQTAGGPPLQFPEITGNAEAPDFSPDGSMIVFVGSAYSRDAVTPGGPAKLAARNGIYTIPTFGRSPSRIADGDGHPRFSPDGKSILFQRGINGIFTVPAAGGTARQISPKSFSYAVAGVFTPDGKHVLFLGRPDGISDEQRDWWVISLDNGELTQTGAKEVFRAAESLSETDQFYCFPSAWLGHKALFWCDYKERSNLYTAPVQQGTWKVSGPVERVTFGSGGHERNPSASDSGRIVFSTGVRGVDIFEHLGDPATGVFADREPRQLTSHGADLHHITLARDRRRMAYGLNRETREVWSRDPVDKREQILAAGRVFRPVISPDGEKVAYHQPRDRGSRIVITPFEGGENRFLCEECQLVQGWTPDSRKVMWGYTNYYGLIATDVATGAQETWIDRKRSVQSGGFSSDGKWLSLSLLGFDGSSPAGYAVPVGHGRPAPESEWIRIRSGASQMQWGPGGNILYYLSAADSYLCLYGQKLDPITKHPKGAPLDVFHLHSADRSLFGTWMIPFNFALTKTGAYLTIVRAQSDIWTLE